MTEMKRKVGRPKGDPRFKKVAGGYKHPRYLLTWLRAYDGCATTFVNDAILAEARKAGLVVPGEPGHAVDADLPMLLRDQVC